MKIFYMCYTDWTFELGECKCEVYSSLESLAKNRECVSTCGAVKVSIDMDSMVTQVEVVIPENRNYKNGI